MTLLGNGDIVPLDRATHEFVYLPVKADRDLSDLVLEVAVDASGFDVWPWDGDTTTSVKDGVTSWHRTGRRMVAGPDADDPGDALTLEAGLHEVRWRLTGSDETPVRPTSRIEVA